MNSQEAFGRSTSARLGITTVWRMGDAELVGIDYSDTEGRTATVERRAPTPAFYAALQDETGRQVHARAHTPERINRIVREWFGA